MPRFRQRNGRQRQIHENVQPPRPLVRLRRTLDSPPQIRQQHQRNAAQPDGRTGMAARLYRTLRLHRHRYRFKPPARRSLGMLARCRDVWRKKAAGLDLVHCNAEDLPFADNMFDVVFHVGGINFFSDKQKAINEMLRVAKPGTKIMIADETTDFIQQQYKKSLFTRNYFQDTDFDLTEIENCIPETVQEKKTRLLWDNRFYCITFRKPA